MQIKSQAFKNKEMIPSKFTCDGEDVNPALLIEDVPEQAKSLALIVDDPDAPAKTWCCASDGIGHFLNLN